jgi:hexosaminidase
MKTIKLSFINIVLIAITTLILFSCEKKSATYTGIIPMPDSIELKDGSFTINQTTSIVTSSDSSTIKTAEIFHQFISHNFNINLSIEQATTKNRNTIVFLLSNGSSTVNGEYSMDITRNVVTIKSSTNAGLFYGMQSLKQLLSPKTIIEEPVLPCLYINDYPQFEWRGFMLDVSRHFLPKDSVKKIIDIMAMHKLNKFHWHLVDGIGWRIQIDKYPLLTERGAWRVTKPKDKPWKQYETCLESESDSCYGGFYTTSDIREIVKYASERYIDVIPEIEMPGHSHAALECYPELVCVNQPNQGVYCAGNDNTFDFLEDVLTEITALFPYEYIHVGGDEVRKNNWENCTLCKKRMKQNGLDNGEELQSYFINRIETFLYNHGKKMIGWDEILEGGVPPRATVMSWRGMEGGIKSANAGHDVIMTPTDPCYFDFKQGNSEMEPDAYHGFNNLLKIYDFNPVPKNINSEKREHIIGVQANLWTEKIPSISHAEYMILPRLSALSEVAWTAQGKKNKADFIKRVDIQFDRFKEDGYNFAWSSATPEAKVTYDKENKSFMLTLNNELGLYDIHYTLDGTEADYNSDIYSKAITFTSPIDLSAKCYRNGQFVGYPLISHFSTGFKDKWKLKYKYQFNDAYNGGGERALCDNRRAETRGDDKRWQAFPEDDLNLTIDLGGSTIISEIGINFFQYRGVSSATFPKKITVSVSSDGIKYNTVFESSYKDINENAPLTRLINAQFTKQKASYVHIEAENWKKIPGKDIPAWLFVDEIDIK